MFLPAVTAFLKLTSLTRVSRLCEGCLVCQLSLFSTRALVLLVIQLAVLKLMLLSIIFNGHFSSFAFWDHVVSTSKTHFQVKQILNFIV